MSNNSLGPPQSQSGDLCDACADVFAEDSPILGQLHNLNPFAPSQQLTIGPVSRVWESKCPFCRLVSQATLEIQRNSNLTVEPNQVVAVQWYEKGGLPGFYICLLGNGTNQETIISFTKVPQAWNSTISPGRSLACFRDIKQSQIDFDRVRSWLDRCDAEHTKCTPVSYQPGTPVSLIFPGLRVLRFIDVEANCIVETDRYCRYMTLSYVWGSVAVSLRLTRASKPQLSQPGVLKQLSLSLPRTITDAMLLTKSLGQRYLWVDSLCLVQNDPQDVQSGTAVMDLIYELSNLTIIAATGHNSEAGLPGVRDGSRPVNWKPQSLQVLPGVKMRVHTHLRSLLSASVYSTRAWT